MRTRAICGSSSPGQRIAEPQVASEPCPDDAAAGTAEPAGAREERADAVAEHLTGRRARLGSGARPRRLGVLSR
jgi:hypothetical protein